LLFQGLPVLGLLSFISLREKYHAIVNQGASFNGRHLSTAPDLTTDDHHFIMLCTRTPRHYQISSPLKPRILGSAAYHVTCVANGSALAGIETTPKLWDIAAAILILTEAGGCYRCLDEGVQLFPLAPHAANYARTPFSMMAAANQSIMDELTPKVTRRL
jgi:myo-inositol-1(or 4)-monophosphatase